MIEILEDHSLLLDHHIVKYSNICFKDSFSLVLYSQCFNTEHLTFTRWQFLFTWFLQHFNTKDSNIQGRYWSFFPLYIWREIRKSLKCLIQALIMKRPQYESCSFTQHSCYRFYGSSQRLVGKIYSLSTRLQDPWALYNICYLMYEDQKLSTVKSMKDTLYSSKKR